jgi:hypothetical protein
MTPALEGALAAVREGRESEAEAVRAELVELERVRLDLALMCRRGDAARALELASTLWHVAEVDPTVLAVLVRLDHPELRESADELLRRSISDASYDVTCAWQRLAEVPGDLDAWRDVICSLVASGRALEAVDGVARALSERHSDFSLWSILTITLMAHRRRGALLAAVELARRAFPFAPEARAACAMIFLGLGDLATAARELDSVGDRAEEHPLIVSARSAIAEAHAAAPDR